MSKYIKLTQGKFTLVDNSDFEFLNSFKWQYRHGYASRCAVIDGDVNWNIQMHNQIMLPSDILVVDHINRDPLDNRRMNLRIVSSVSNRYNSRRKIGSSKYKGVFLVKRNNKWRSQIMKDKKKIHLGYFTTEDQAAIAYNASAKVLFGECAFLNEVHA